MGPLKMRHLAFAQCLTELLLNNTTDSGNAVGYLDKVR